MKRTLIAGACALALAAMAAVTVISGERMAYSDDDQLSITVPQMVPVNADASGNISSLQPATMENHGKHDCKISQINVVDSPESIDIHPVVDGRAVTTSTTNISLNIGESHTVEVAGYVDPAVASTTHGTPLGYLDWKIDTVQDVMVEMRDGFSVSKKAEFNRIAYGSVAVTVTEEDGSQTQIYAFNFGNDNLDTTTAYQNPQPFVYFRESYTQQQLDQALVGADAEFINSAVTLPPGYVGKIYPYEPADTYTSKGITYVKYHIDLVQYEKALAPPSQLSNLTDWLPAPAEREGWTFMGWSPATSIDGGYITEAQWEPVSPPSKAPSRIPAQVLRSDPEDYQWGDEQELPADLIYPEWRCAVLVQDSTGAWSLRYMESLDDTSSWWGDDQTEANDAVTIHDPLPDWQPVIGFRWAYLDGETTPWQLWCGEAGVDTADVLEQNAPVALEPPIGSHPVLKPFTDDFESVSEDASMNDESLVNTEDATTDDPADALLESDAEASYDPEMSGSHPLLHDPSADENIELESAES